MDVLVALMAALAVICAFITTVAHSRHADYVALWVGVLGIVCPAIVGVAGTIHNHWNAQEVAQANQPPSASDTSNPLVFGPVTPTEQKPPETKPSPPLDYNLGIAPPNDADSPKPKRQYLTRPTAKEIFDQLDKAPPFAREQIYKTFIDVPISWNLTFVNARGRDHISLRYEKEMFPHITAPVSFPKDNFLLQTTEGTVIHVEGVIRSVDQFTINLEDVDLSLADTTK